LTSIGILPTACHRQSNIKGGKATAVRNMSSVQTKWLTLLLCFDEFPMSQVVQKFNRYIQYHLMRHQ